MKPEKEKNGYKAFIDKDNEWLYLIHHLHHFKQEEGIIHETHHCFLFEKANMNGKKYKLTHVLDSGQLLHCLTEPFEGFLFDHNNNKFSVRKKIINNRSIFEVMGE